MFEDVVGSLPYLGKVLLEVRSSRPLRAAARTYNRATEGTFGQSFALHSADQSLAAGDTAWLSDLRQERDRFRTNLAVAKAGIVDASVRIRELDEDGIAGEVIFPQMAPFGAGLMQAGVRRSRLFIGKVNQLPQLCSRHSEATPNRKVTTGHRSGIVALLIRYELVVLSATGTEYSDRQTLPLGFSNGKILTGCPNAQTHFVDGLGILQPGCN